MKYISHEILFQAQPCNEVGTITIATLQIRKPKQCDSLSPLPASLLTLLVLFLWETLNVIGTDKFNKSKSYNYLVKVVEWRFKQVWFQNQNFLSLYCNVSHHIINCFVYSFYQIEATLYLMLLTFLQIS